MDMQRELVRAIVQTSIRALEAGMRSSEVVDKIMEAFDVAMRNRDEAWVELIKEARAKAEAEGYDVTAEAMRYIAERVRL